MSRLPGKIILLDIGNVIVDVNFATFCSTVAERPEDERKIFEKYCVGKFKDNVDRGRVSVTDFLGTVAADPIVRKIAIRELKDAWQNVFSLKEGCVEGVQRLKKRHRVWIMSDTDPLHFTYLLNAFPVLRTMERYYLSYEHGFLKNSTEAFLHVMQSSGSEVDQLLLIDDKPDNCFSCGEAGIDSILFTSWNDLQEKPGIA